MKRVIPEDVPDFERSIDFLINDFLAVKDFDDIKCVEMKNLLFRNDMFSSVELYTISRAIQKFYYKNKKWMNNYRNSILNDTNQNARSFTFELVSAFYATIDKRQKVDLCSVSQEGCDWRIEKNNITMNVSCKKLGYSEDYLEYQALCSKLFEELHEKCKIKNSGHFFCICDNEYDQQVKKEISILGEKFDPTNSFPQVIFHKQPRIISCLSENVDKHPFRADIYCKFPLKEQKRFNNLLGKAAKNMKKYFQDQINIIFINIPVYVSMNEAEKWLLGNFKSRYSTISAVIINRNTLVKSDGKWDVLNEYKFVKNPKNIFLNTMPNIELGFLFGEYSFNDSISIFNFNGSTYDMSDSYHYGYEVNKPNPEFILL